MKTATLFRHYANARRMVEEAIHQRGTDFAIRVKKDHYALMFQRYIRLVEKLHIRILCRLDPTHIKKITSLKLCRKCYYSEWQCTCKGDFKPIKHYGAFIGQENKLLRAIMYEMMDDNRAGMSMLWADRVFYVKRIADVLGAMDEYDKWLEGPLPF